MVRVSIFIGTLCTILAFRFFFFYHNGTSYTNEQQVRLETILLTEPTQDGKFQRITARLAHGERVFITTTLDPLYTYGQSLEIAGKLQIKKGDPGVIYSMSFPHIKAVAPSGIFGLISPLRARIIWLFHSSLPEPQASLLLGIVFGIQGALPKDFQKALQTAGVLHVIAASGMNVTMIAGFLSGLFGRFMRRQYSLVVSILAIVFYAILSGLSASIVRASIMGCLIFVAQIMGRQTLAIYCLVIAGFCMLLWEPFLIFDTGFQLSFVATWGLIVFSPLAQRVVSSKLKIIVLLTETDFLTTFIAQVVTLPILLGTFGFYSPVSILVNFLVLWSIPMLMILGGVGAFMGLIVPFIGKILFYLSLPFLYYFTAVVWFFGTMPITISVKGLPWEIILGYYLLVIAFALVSRSLGKPPNDVSISNEKNYTV